MHDEVTRRGFLTEGVTAGAALSALAGAAILVGPADADDKPQVVALPFSDYKDLAKVGGSAEATLPNGTEVIVAHVDEETYACCTLRCPHANCKVVYDGKVKRFVCPCHNSQFDLDGKVLQGPSRRPLQKLDAEQAVVVRGDKK